MSHYPAVENRGPDDVPFGFVYVAENVRIGFNGAGEDGPARIWAGNWDTPRIQHFAIAWRALVKAGVKDFAGDDAVIHNLYDYDDTVSIPCEKLAAKRGSWASLKKYATFIKAA